MEELRSQMFDIPKSLDFFDRAKDCRFVGAYCNTPVLSLSGSMLGP